MYKNVTWQNVSSFGGNGSEIPKLLHDIEVSDATSYLETLELLADTVYHQGSLCQASSLVIPSLLQILASDSQGNKPEVADLLYLLGLAAMYPPQDTNQVDTFKTLKSGVEVFLHLIEHPVIEMRMAACRLLSLFPELLPEIATAIFIRFDNESHDGVKASLLWCLRHLIENNHNLPESIRTNYIFHVLSLDINSVYLLSRFSQALLLAEQLREATPEIYVNELISAIKFPDRYGYIPWGEVALWSASNAIAIICQEGNIAIFKNALNTVSTSENSHILVLALLHRLAANEKTDVRHLGKVTQHSNPGHIKIIYSLSSDGRDISLTSHVKSLIHLIIDNETFWEVDNNIFALYNLPAARDALRDLLSN